MCKVLYLVTIFIISIVNHEAAKILGVFPTPSVSHQVVFRPLIQELVRRGHEVVVLTTDPVFPEGKSPVNLTEIDLHNVSYTMWRKELLKTDKGTKSDPYEQMKDILQIFVVIFEKQMQNDAVLKLINDKNTTFDLLLIEACFRPALVFSHLYKAPVILLSSLGATLGNYEAIGAPVDPFLYPLFTQKIIYNHTLWEKVLELQRHILMRSFFNSHEEKENVMLQNMFGSDVPPLSELYNNIDMLFVNVHPIWEGNYPVPPGVIYMGGIYHNPEKELPTELKSYLDSSTRGVIYMSFGTNVIPSLLPKEYIQVFVKVFSELPYDVLWKWDADELPGKTKNIKISKWLPQPDLLRHPKIKLFITQGGLQSTDEAIAAGVPLIGVPIFTDQWYNVEKYVHHKIGLKLDIETITETKLKNAINEVIEDESYRRNVARLRTLMNDQPQPALERAVWWTEYVLRHSGARHLRSPAANISWADYLQLQLVVVLLTALLIAVIVVTATAYYAWKLIAKNFMYSVKIKSA